MPKIWPRKIVEGVSSCNCGGGGGCGGSGAPFLRICESHLWKCSPAPADGSDDGQMVGRWPLSLFQEHFHHDGKCEKMGKDFLSPNFMCCRSFLRINQFIKSQ